MAKRGAVSELNDRNWNDEEEPEEAGVFTQASQETMQQRLVKKAKRRGVADSDSRPMAFSGFGGLAAKSAQPKDDGGKAQAGETLFSGKSSVFGGASSLNGTGDQKVKGQSNASESSSYLHALKSLNESVLAWIKQHVEENPYIILTPIFKDYEKYLEKIETKRSSASPTTVQSTKKDSSSKPAESCGPASFKPPTSSCAAVEKTNETDDKGKEGELAKSNTFSFGLTSPSQGFLFGGAAAATTNGDGIKFSTSSSMPGFAFSKKSEPSTAPGSSGFSFGSSTSSQGSFSFGVSSAGSSSASGAQETESKDDEEYVPPKPEVKEITEEDALYSIRCKLYYQRDGQWVDRGVGNLHLKPVPENKTQLLIRADTNLGNILLNVMLLATMPMSRQGKNNVFLVCVPNPPINTKADNEPDETPVPMLIRVKTADNADELLNKMEERKNML